MAIDVCMPWRPQPDRVAAHDRVVSWWSRHGFNVIEADSDRRMSSFHICQARNKAVRQAHSDVIVVADADTLPDLGAVEEAVNTVQPGEVVWPFTFYRHIPGDTVTESDLHSIPFDREYKNSVGGLFVCHRDTYWAFGGMDERFEPRWGYEDSAFQLVVSALGKVRRMKGVVYSFNHEADRDLTAANPNRRRFELYRLCVRSPELMRELIK